MTFLITKRFAFSASHVLDGLPDDHPCSRLHGHNYEVEVVCGRDWLDEHGFVVDYRALDPVKQFVDDTLDHRHLNDVVPGPPSAERLAAFIWDWCKVNLPATVVDVLVAVRVSETPRTWAEYRPAR